MSDMLAVGQSVHATPQACLVDTTPPTFAGIAGLVANPNGSLTASWPAATDATVPIFYRVYIQLGTATGLFASGNLVAIAPALSLKLFHDAAGVVLQAGGNYHVGVRAVDGVGNAETNTISLVALSSGVLSDSLAEIVGELDGLVTALAQSVSPELTGFVVEDDLQAVADADENLTAQLECED